MPVISLLLNLANNLARPAQALNHLLALLAPADGVVRLLQQVVHDDRDAADVEPVGLILTAAVLQVDKLYLGTLTIMLQTSGWTELLPLFVPRCATALNAYSKKITESRVHIHS